MSHDTLYLFPTLNLDDITIEALTYDSPITRRSVATQTNCSSENLRCMVCHQIFASYKGLRQHTGKSHSSEAKGVSCPLCPKQFFNRQAVKFHVRQVHEKSTRVTCKDCGKVIYNKYMLQRHCKAFH
jgi:hypothetical protein